MTQTKEMKDLTQFSLSGMVITQNGLFLTEECLKSIHSQARVKQSAKICREEPWRKQMFLGVEKFMSLLIKVYERE